MSRPVIYCFKASHAGAIQSEECTIKFWQPSRLSLRPPGKPAKYAIYTAYKKIGIFKNPFYYHVSCVKSEVRVSSMLVVPAHYVWPFMGRCDVQFTYVMTDSRNTGRGYASALLRSVIIALESKVDKIWYVTNEKNEASIALAKKLGFNFCGFGKRRGRLFKRLQLDGNI